MKAKIRGTELFFDVAGMNIVPDGNKMLEKPVLFLIHGGPGGNHIRFKYDSIQLANEAQLIFIDQRGCGWSKKTKPSDYTLENNIEDIEALRQYLGLKKICILGISYGGMVAQGYAIRYPKNVEKLILVVTSPSHHFLQDAREHLAKVGNAKQIAICDKFLWHGQFRSDKDMNAYFKALDPLYFYSGKKRKKPATKNISLGELKSFLSYDVLNAGFGGFLHHFNFIPKLKKITAPTLVLAGKNDWICLPKQSKIIADNIPNAQLKIFNKCSHALTTDANKRYVREVRRFLRAP